jgi:hypothetical protein
MNYRYAVPANAVVSLQTLHLKYTVQDMNYRYAVAANAVVSLQTFHLKYTVQFPNELSHSISHGISLHMLCIFSTGPSKDIITLATIITHTFNNFFSIII